MIWKSIYECIKMAGTYMRYFERNNIWRNLVYNTIYMKSSLLGRALIFSREVIFQSGE